MEAKFYQRSLAAAPPDATQMQHHATLSAKSLQPSRRDAVYPNHSPKWLLPRFPGSSDLTCPKRRGHYETKGSTRNWLRSPERRRAALPNRPGPRQPTVASNRRAAPILIPMRGLHSHPLRSLRRHPAQAPPRTPTPLISMAMASFVQFCIRPESRPRRTTPHKSAQSRTTGASTQNPAPAREARPAPPLAFSREFSHHHIPQATTKG